MGKSLYIAEKPSVAKEFAKVLGVTGSGRDGYMESDDAVVTWCVGHLVTMSYPEIYDESMKKWSLNTLPFLPDNFLYEVIPAVKKQFNIVSGLLNRPDVESIYVCTDSGREGEYIYRLVDQMAHVPNTKKKYRVWIDSQTEEEILRGVKEAKTLDQYDNLSDSAYLRAKEDYLMGINFSRVLSLRYGSWLNNHTTTKKWASVSVGRVMSCVLGMVVAREWEIRNFVKTPFYRLRGDFSIEDSKLCCEWKVGEGSQWSDSRQSLYKDNGFKTRDDALKTIDSLGSYEVVSDDTSDATKKDKSASNTDTQADDTISSDIITNKTTNKTTKAVIEEVKKKSEKKNPPLLFNLAELQNLSSKLFKITPDETLQIVQDLYEKKLVTYPRTDARVLSTAVAKEINKNLNGLREYEFAKTYLGYIAENKSYQGLEKTRYVNDKKITDHYAIIPTGSGVGGLRSMSELHQKMYEVIVRRFLSIFYPPAIYQKLSITVAVDTVKNTDNKTYTERFYTSAKVLSDEGYLPVADYSFTKSDYVQTSTKNTDKSDNDSDESEEFENADLTSVIDKLKKGTILDLVGCEIKEGETSPPKRYNSGNIILAMENAGQLIEDEELRATIKGSGIGTSATRAEILKKLFNIGYLKLNKKTQVISPALTGELVYSVLCYSMPMMLSPKMTASWELGLTQVAEGKTGKDEYMTKLAEFITRNVDKSKNEDHMSQINTYYTQMSKYY